MDGSWNEHFRASGLNRRRPLMAVAVLICLSLFILPNWPSRTRGSQPEGHTSSWDLTDSRSSGVSETPSTHYGRPSHDTEVPVDTKPPRSKYAFATYLSDNPQDQYFEAVRLLTYQIVHAPETRSQSKIPLLILCPPALPQEKRERLRRDGALVVEVQPLTADWFTTDNHNWDDMFSKLRLHQFTEYERILFMDGDTVLNRPLDDIFQDPAVREQTTLINESAIHSDEAALPPTYVFAGITEMAREHHYPPISQANGDFANEGYFNGGFFIIQPQPALFTYYQSVMAIPNRFDSQLMEQSMLNYAHRSEGNMPWAKIDHTWNIHYPTRADLDGGCASLHEKWWAPVDTALLSYLGIWKGRMEGFYEAMDSLAEVDR